MTASAPGGTADEVDAQLGYLAAIGINSVRVWLSYPLWEEDRGLAANRMVDRFRHFVGLCERHRLYVMPVLWDSHCTGTAACTDPDYSDRLGVAALRCRGASSRVIDRRR